jgi:hypothetical protein
MQPGSPGVAPSLLFNWRRRMLEGGLQAVQLTVTFATKQSRAPLEANTNDEYVPDVPEDPANYEIAFMLRIEQAIQMAKDASFLTKEWLAVHATRLQSTWSLPSTLALSL